MFSKKYFNEFLHLKQNQHYRFLKYKKTFLKNARNIKRTKGIT